MKKLCIFGANGQTGIQIVEQALKEGLYVRACVKRKESIKDYANKIEIIEYSFVVIYNQGLLRLT